MLIENLKNAYHEWVGQMPAAQPVVTVPLSRSAANSPRFAKTEMQARRLRRQRRQQRTMRHAIHGWSVRTW
ncbi:MAG: hypothetical protein HKN57_10300 [Xanthomonadales bacterium]|nr:hypothetical protein [Gammaproteobacteria bacterium]MBT8053753.1 hypothetical protein [Gammaproteobacteria bacterium]NND57636.1 hypothetical protein [Xanthomonadales bacterium]NNK51590.1 hypothetical protein [Xanthomonadales bacterium]